MQILGQLGKIVVLMGLFELSGRKKVNQDNWDVCHQIGRFLVDIYIHKYIHSHLDYLTLLDFDTSGLDSAPKIRYLVEFSDLNFLLYGFTTNFLSIIF